MPTRFEAAVAALAARQAERRSGGVSSRTERRDRQRLEALNQHPGVIFGEEVPSGPKGMQGPDIPQQPGDQWTGWQVTPSYGGKSGRRMSDMARFNSEAGVMQVRFSSGGRGTPNTYEYIVDAPTFNAFMSGRLGYNGTATHAFLTGWGGIRIS